MLKRLGLPYLFLIFCYVAAIEAFLLPKIEIRQAFCGTASQIFASPISRNLQGGTGKPNGNNDDEEIDEEDEDFPIWAEGLGQWPLLPTEASVSENNDPSPVSTGGAGKSFLGPLTSLLNLQAEMADEIDNATSSLTGETTQTAAADTSSARDSLLNIVTSKEINAWDQWAGGLKDRVSDLAKSADGSAFTKSAEVFFEQATSQIESLLENASSAILPSTINALIFESSQALQNSTTANLLIKITQNISLDQDLDGKESANLAKDTTAYASELVKVADSVLRKGYTAGSSISQQYDFLDNFKVPPVIGSQALFSSFLSASEIKSYSKPIAKAAEMGVIAGSAYEDEVSGKTKHGHTLVAEGNTEDVFWVVTDSISDAAAFTNFDEPSSSEEKILVRTITIRGFDASDEGVDREKLLNRLCTASPETLDVNGKAILVHSGLMDIARSIYADIVKYIDWTSPSHRIVVNGHSIGGSLSILILFLITLDRGPDFVREKIPRVFTFGNPPVARLLNQDTNYPDFSKKRYHCDILEAFKLPTSLVYGFSQPWDPIVRLFSGCDPLYPLFGDVGIDGVSLYSSGPPRTLRPITKALWEAWDGWPQFRDIMVKNGLGDYTSVGIQHIFLPDSTRYLSDRFLSVNVAVPPVETILRISPRELLPALQSAFPLDTFEVSFLPQAIRSFIHHFYPAYSSMWTDYLKLLESQSNRPTPRKKAEEALSSKERTV